MMHKRGRILFVGAAPALLALLTFPPALGFTEDRPRDVAEWIAALGADSAAERDEAFDALVQRGDAARDALERAASAKDPRVRDAVGQLLERLADTKAAGRLRLKDRFGAPRGEELPKMPAFPRLRPFPGTGEGDAAEFEAWNREWNGEVEEWNRQLDAWVRQAFEGAGGTGGFQSLVPGAAGSVQTFRSDGEGSAGYELKVDADGRVTAKVTREQDGERTEETIESESLEQFEADHPEVAAALGLGGQGKFLQPFEGPFFGGPGGAFGLRLGPGLQLPMRPTLPPSGQAWPGGSALRQVGGPRLGVQVAPIEAGDPLRAHVALDPGTGLLIVEVVPGSLAEELGVRKNDILVEVGGAEVGGPSDVRAGLEAADRDAIEVVVIREGTRRVLRRGV